MEDHRTKVEKGTKFLDDALEKVIHAIDLGLTTKQRNTMVQKILKRKDDQKNTLFDLIKQQTSSRYALLLGFCFMLGIGTLKDETEALKNWEKDDSSYGNYIAGVCYITGCGTVDVNHEKAFSYFQKSANAGNACGQNALGACYEKGQGCNKDPIAAFSLYEQSAQAGNSDGEC